MTELSFNNQYSFWGNLFMGDGKYRKYFNSILIILGLIIGVVVTDFSQWSEVAFFVTAYCLGVPCVITLADREGKLGNILGIMSNIGEMATFAFFGTWGMVLSGLYFGIMHVVGLLRWENPKYQSKDGKVSVTKMNKEQMVFTLVFFVVGMLAVVLLGDSIGFSISSMGVLVYWLNVVTFAVSITAQFLMIMGRASSWLFWGSSNFVNFTLNLFSGNVWFMFRDVIYQVNAIAGYYQWNKLAKSDRLENKNAN